MNAATLDIFLIAAYFIILLLVGFWKGRGKRSDSSQYFISKGTLPWWVITASFVATGMNTEQLIGQNGMGYTIGLTMVNWYTIVMFVYSALIFVFFPLYMRNQIITMPEYLARRFDRRSADVFSILLLLSYVLLNLAVVFYGGAKLLEGVMGLNVYYGVLLLGVVSGIYTMYGGMSSASYTAVVQFALIFISGFALFTLAYLRLPNGWSDVVQHAPGGFHLIQPMDYPVIPWHAIPMTLLGLHLYYSCINQSLVQRGFGAKSEWDVRMAMIVAGLCVLMRPFVEIFPGMMCRAIGAYDPNFNLGENPEDIDIVFPLLIKLLVPAGLRGLMLIGILASVMSTISALLNSISTLFTLDVYKKWIDPQASETRLVQVGTWATLVLMVFSVFYSPQIGVWGGGIFKYFQSMASYLAVPIATVFLFGLFWSRTTPAAALTVLIVGIPLGALEAWSISHLFSEAVIEAYSLDNFFIGSGITQLLCAAVIVGVSLVTQSRPVHEISTLLFSRSFLGLPAGEPRRPFYQSIGLWWSLFIFVYTAIYIVYW